MTLTGDITGYLIGGSVVAAFVIAMVLIFRAINRSMMKKLGAFARRHGLSEPQTKSFGREPRCHGEVSGRRVEYHAYDSGEIVGASSDTGPGQVIKHTALSVSLGCGLVGMVVLAGRYTMGESRRARKYWPTSETPIPHAKLAILATCLTANADEASRLLADAHLCETLAQLLGRAEYVEIGAAKLKTVMPSIVVDEPALTEQLGLLMLAAQAVEQASAAAPSNRRTSSSSADGTDSRH